MIRQLRAELNEAMDDAEGERLRFELGPVELSLTVGLRRCPDGANADNPLFSRSRTAWTAAARTWITEPTREGALLLSSIAADSRPITEVTIGRAVTDAIRETTRSADYLDALLRFALNASPRRVSSATSWSSIPVSTAVA